MAATPALPEAAPVGLIVLAAGRSTRMGGDNKLLCDVGGEPMVRRVAATALASRARPVHVVVGHQGAQVKAALAGLDVTCIDNPDYASGLSSSLKAGIASLPKQLVGALVVLGDMPSIHVADLERLLEVFDAAAARAIVVPVHNGQRGNPVLWPADLFAQLMQLAGDAGARQLFASHAERIAEVTLEHAAVLMDVDTPESLAQLRARLAP
jgi:molybdenum cofactor cytidylyltransferase